MHALRPQTGRQTRTGTIYLLVLYTGLIVSTIGFGGLLLMRVHGQTAQERTDFIEARTYARAAIEIGMLKIRNDPYWRTRLGNGPWVTNQALGQGVFSLWATDPLDNDVTKGDNHPVVLTGTGAKGRAVFKTSVRLEVGPRTGSCLEVSMISGNDSAVSGAVLTSDQTVSSNRNYSAGSGAIVNADVEAYGSISGSTYTKTKTQRTVSRDMPNKLTAFDYYLANGTTILYSDLIRWTQTEILTNTGFELDTSGWFASGGVCVLERSATQSRAGSYSLLVKSRKVVSAVAAQDLPLQLMGNGNTYQLSLPVFPSAACTAQAVLTVTSTGDGAQTFATPAETLQKNASGVFTWVELKGNVTPTWTGELTQATVSVAMSVKNNYYMDKVSLLDVTFPKDDYILDRQLLSPSVNPYGSRQANPLGIYVIDCAGKDVIIGRARIVGTLVLLQPGGNSIIQGPVTWEPARYNFPALLTNGTLQIGFHSAAAVDEMTVGINLNPTGTPYPYPAGVANDSLGDVYPGRIAGLIYGSRDLKFSNASSLSGVVIADGKISVAATSLNLNYGNTYLNDPPPGFDVGTIEMRVVGGSWQRVVDR